VVHELEPKLIITTMQVNNTSKYDNEVFIRLHLVSRWGSRRTLNSTSPIRMAA